MKPARVALLVVVALASCTDVRQAPRPAPTPSPAITPSATATATPSPSPVPAEPRVFEADRAMRTVEALARRMGPRETTSAAYRRAADLIAGAFETLGYVVERQAFDVPAGTSSGHAVPRGSTLNVIGRPVRFDPEEPHVLVGAHLDTVPRTPGANDNATGIAVMMEIARIARLQPGTPAIVFVAFGGEERRRQGSGGLLYGSRHFVRTMRAPGLRGAMILDVVGRGSTIYAARHGSPPRALIDATLATAKRIGVASRERGVRNLFSDHIPFEEARIPTVWLWTGEYAQLHRPSDTPAIVQLTALDRAGRLAWETLRSVRL